MISVFDISHFLFLRCTLGDASHASFGFTRGVGDDAGVGDHVHKDGDYIVFKDCLFTNKWRTGIGTWAEQKRLLVDRCKFSGIGRKNHQCPWADDRNRISSAIYNSGSYNIFRRNTFYGNDNPYGLRAGVMAGTYFKSGHNWFYGNTVYDTDVCDGNDPTSGGAQCSGVIVFGGSNEADYTVSEYSRFINNIFWKIEGDNVNRHISVFGVGYPRNNIIKHNIFGDPNTTFQGRWTAPGIIRTIAQLEQQHGDWISGAGTHYNFDPLFVAPDAATPDFRLKQNSQAINRGTWLTTIISNTANNQTSITLEDATPFYSGSGSPWFIEGETGDVIKTKNGQVATIQSIDYETNRIMVSPAISIVRGEGVALNYFGSAPDIGAKEYGDLMVEIYSPPKLRIE